MKNRSKILSKLWLESSDPEWMLCQLEHTSPRKLRLLACACCRSIWALFTDARSHHSVEISERFANGSASEEELRVALHATLGSTDDMAWIAAWVAMLEARTVAEVVVSHLVGVRRATKGREPVFIADMVRDVFGNPFMPVAFDDRWRTIDVMGVAQHIYDSRDYGLPIQALADALGEAGCGDDAIHNHLRLPGIHVRGCWVIDLILGK